MWYGLVEVLYFGFFCFEPWIWPDIQPPETCKIPFTYITMAYVGMILVIMIPSRLSLQARRRANPETNT